jgi:hypothetical protein
MVAEFVGIRLRGEDRALGILKRWSMDIIPQAARFLQEAAEETLVPAVKKEINDQGLIFERSMLGAIGTHVAEIGDRAVVEMGALGVPYAYAVERGQNPGTTQDVNILIKYAQVKLGYKKEDAIRVGNKLKRSIEQKGSKVPFFGFGS